METFIFIAAILAFLVQIKLNRFSTSSGSSIKFDMWFALDNNLN